MATINRQDAWRNIFDRYRILSDVNSNGYADITATQMKVVDGKEARNLAKIDFRENLPIVMRENGLSILAIKNGTYRIARNDPFISINKEISTPIIQMNSPENLITVDPYNITNESAGLDIAAISGMHNILFEEESTLTLRGRNRGSLNFNLGGTSYNVDGVQIEVDGGYESQNAIHLIEGKIGYRNNINIRQLLYPHLLWEEKAVGRKTVKSYIFYLQDDIYRFIPYIYDGIIGYADHSNEKAFRFRTPSPDFSLYEIEINNNNIDQSVPFPQANNFDTINTMLIEISQHACLSKDELKTYFDIDDRQIDYYFNVLKWLKVCIEENECLILTQQGARILNLPFIERIEELAKIVFSEPIVNNVLHERVPNPTYFSNYNMNSQVTINRRLSTVRSWINYFKSILEVEE